MALSVALEKGDKICGLCE